MDYNGDDGLYGREEIAVKNLYDVARFRDPDAHSPYTEWWDNLEKRSKECEPVRTIRVRFEVKNGGWGLWESEGLVSTQDDSCVVYNRDICANDFTIAVPHIASDGYLNVRRKAGAGPSGTIDSTYVKAKVKPKNCVITLDYNGSRKVAAKNLYDVTVGASSGTLPGGALIGADWQDAKGRSGNYK